MQSQRVSIVGRLADIRGDKVLCSGSLRNCYALADHKLNRLLDDLDQWAFESGMDGSIQTTERFSATEIPEKPILSIDLEKHGISTVVWATGFRPDYSWLKLPVMDHNGKLIHERGIVGTKTSNTPGLNAMGLSYMRKRKSSTIYGAADDANHLAAKIHQHLLTADQPLPVAC